MRYSFVKSRFCEGIRWRDGAVRPESASGGSRVWICDDLEVKGGYRYVSSPVLAGASQRARRLAGYSVFDVGLSTSRPWAEG